MYAVLQEEPDARTSNVSIAIIESAYKPFLGRETTYNVAHYAVTGEYTSDLWELKKTPASKHKALTYQGGATIVMNDRTGEVLSCSYVPQNCDH